MAKSGKSENSYSVAEARNDLPGLIHAVDRRGPVKITRRGKPVAVLLSIDQYDRIAAPRPTFTEAYAAWRSSTRDVAVDRAHFERLRDRRPGRAVDL